MDNAAAELGYAFDGAQWIVNLVINGSYTVIDRVRFHPRVAVYLDGIQHEIREAADPQDMLQQLDLENQGWIVVRVKDADIKRDPIGEARKVMYAF
jgi:very-short-patch-repair endonuclease